MISCHQATQFFILLLSGFINCGIVLSLWMVMRGTMWLPVKQNILACLRSCESTSCQQNFYWKGDLVSKICVSEQRKLLSNTERRTQNAEGVKGIFLPKFHCELNQNIHAFILHYDHGRLDSVSTGGIGTIATIQIHGNTPPYYTNPLTTYVLTREAYLIAFTCDGLAANHRLFQLQNPGDKMIHKLSIHTYVSDSGSSLILPNKKCLV